MRRLLALLVACLLCAGCGEGTLCFGCGLNDTTSTTNTTSTSTTSTTTTSP
jgi:ABC-type glycerol-3-phosphate transport system substrate-binding protein